MPALFTETLWDVFCMPTILFSDLLSASIDGLQKMLNVCSTVATEIHLTFNCNKSACLDFGPNWRNAVTDMYFSGSSVGWTSSYKYLGVTLLSGPQFKIDTGVIRRKFYASSNTVLVNSFRQDDIVRLHLVESYCLPVLQYCWPAIKLTNAQINEINVC